MHHVFFRMEALDYLICEWMLTVMCMLLFTEICSIMTIVSFLVHFFVSNTFQNADFTTVEVIIASITT